METEYSDQEAREANDQNSKNPVNSDQGDTKQPNNTAARPGENSEHATPAVSTSYEKSSMPNTGQQGSDQYENNSRPSLERRASEDDELGEEMPEDYRREDFIEENELERTDQDYRDGENQSGENQDDEDALRNGK